MPMCAIHAKFRPLVNAFALARLALVFALCLGGLVACGKRPAQVDPPSGVSEAVYTRTYPDIRTDGRP